MPPQIRRLNREGTVPTVLVVDDDPDVRGVIELALTPDYDVAFAEDGLEAIEVLGDRNVDVLLLDIMMPRLDGIETLKRIRVDSKFEELPVILLTARVGEDDHLRGFQAGADAYVTKPFEPDELVQMVEEVRRRSPDQRAKIRDEEKAKAALLRQLERRFR